MNTVEDAIAEVYKQESAKILAVLTRLFGTDNFSLAEDVLQDAFSKALFYWKENEIPENPSAWIIQTAKNLAIDNLRSNKARIKLSNDLAHLLESEWSINSTIEDEFSEHKIKDDQLRMIFMCCREEIKPANRIPFILKNLCGFSISAVSRSLLIPEATVKKRLLRTKKQMAEYPFELPEDDKLLHSMNSVNTVLYLLFNEGFHSSHKEKSIYLIFCQEAIGLVSLLIDEPKIANRETLALFALMHFHIARVDSKTDKAGQPIPIDLQDRSMWKKEYIKTANFFLKQATQSSIAPSGRFYVEAQIAKEHCEAKDFKDTDWGKISTYYEKLLLSTDTPVTRLNQAIAIGYAGNLKNAILKVEALRDSKNLANSHIPSATLAHLHAKAGKPELAYLYAKEAKEKGGTPLEHRLMMSQIERLLAN